MHVHVYVYVNSILCVCVVCLTTLVADFQRFNSEQQTLLARGCGYTCTTARAHSVCRRCRHSRLCRHLLSGVVVVVIVWQ